MEPVVNRTAIKYNYKNLITNNNYGQNLMSILKKVTAKSISHQIKPKQNEKSYTLLEKVLDLSSMRLGNRSAKISKRKRGSNIRFHF